MTFFNKLGCTNLALRAIGYALANKCHTSIDIDHHKIHTIQISKIINSVNHRVLNFRFYSFVIIGGWEGPEPGGQYHTVVDSHRLEAYM